MKPFTPDQLNPDFLWQPEDPYATRPPGQPDEHGRYSLEYSGRDEDGNWDYVVSVAIDTRIPLEARKPMSLGQTPVLSYQQWLETQKEHDMNKLKLWLDRLAEHNARSTALPEQRGKGQIDLVATLAGPDDLVITSKAMTHVFNAAGCRATCITAARARRMSCHGFDRVLVYLDTVPGTVEGHEIWDRFFRDMAGKRVILLW